MNLQGFLTATDRCLSTDGNIQSNTDVFGISPYYYIHTPSDTSYNEPLTGKRIRESSVEGKNLHFGVDAIHYPVQSTAVMEKQGGRAEQAEIVQHAP